MFTDIVGYTALMGQDEGKALNLLRKSRAFQQSKVSAYHGTWLKEMGDGSMVQFDSALDAVLCATEIQENIDSLGCRLRIGIHLGEVTLENNDIFGDSVNIAARLQAAAEPGGIFISEAVHQAVKGFQQIKVECIGDVQLKNVARPIATYAIAGHGMPVVSDRKRTELNVSGHVRSLAVLPFRSFTAVPGQEYFIEGMQDALIGELSHIHALRVISRTSTLHYRDSLKSIPEIASELGVDAVVEATILKTDGMVRVQAQLIKAFPQEEQLWFGAYEKEIRNVFALYHDVVTDITDRVDAKLTAVESEKLTKSIEVNPQAYEAYLKGMFHWEKLTAEDLNISLGYFKQAMQIDKNFALAYSAIAGVWLGKMQMGLVSPPEAAPNIISAIRKTIHLDARHADTYFWNAVMTVWYEWDWESGEQAFRKALELNPNYAPPEAYYAHLLIILGRIDEALEHIHHAIKLDPFNPLIQALFGMILNYSRNYEKAHVVLTEALEEVGYHPVLMSALRATYHYQKDYDKAYEIFKESYRTRGDTLTAKTLKRAFKENGYHFALEKAAELMIDQSNDRYITPWQIATLFARAGISDKAIEYLTKAYQLRDPNMPYIAIDPIFDGLRNDDQFQQILSDMNLAE